MSFMFEAETRRLIEEYRSTRWKPSRHGDLTFRVLIDDVGQFLAIDPGAKGPGHRRVIGTCATENWVMMLANVGVAMWEARYEAGYTPEEILALNEIDWARGRDLIQTQERSTQDADR